MSNHISCVPLEPVLINALSEHIAVLNSRGTIILINESWRRFARENDGSPFLFGPGVNYFDACTRACRPDDSPDASAAMDAADAADALTGILQVINREKPNFEMTYACHTPDKKRWYLMRVMPVDAGDAKVILSHIDISRQVRAGRNEAKEHLKRLNAVIEQTPEEVIITDIENRILYVNPAFEKNTGYVQTEVMGKTPAILKSGYHDTAFYKKMWQTILNKHTWKGKLINKARDQRRIVHDTTITPILDGEGAISSFVSVRRDVTEQEQIEKQLQQSSKLEAIGTLAGGIAHDFNNILAAILGYTELIIEDLGETGAPTKTLERLNHVMKSSLRARELVRQILTFSRSGDEDRHFLDVKPLVKEVAKLLYASLPPDITLSLELDSACSVVADPTRIHQIVLNLCTNAADAMQENGGVLSIHTADETVQKKRVSKRHPVPGKFVRIRVRDTGTGMTDDIVKNAMTPFFTTKPKDRGTGMGLSVVQGIVEELNGFIDIKSRPGKGSSVDVYLPASDRQPEPETEKNRSELKGGTETIVFIDDEQLLCQFTKDSLSNLGYHVITFDAGREALRFFRKHHTVVDLVISDITMPNLSGDRLVEKIQEIKPDIPVILITGSSNRISDEMKQRIHFDAVIFKPVTLSQMAGKVREILDGDR